MSDVSFPCLSQRSAAVLAALLLSCLPAGSQLARADEPDVAALAAQYGSRHKVVTAAPGGLLVCEAEEFQVSSPGWQPGNWGENYYAATFANTFLSRKAFLGAPATGPATVATRTVQIPAAGKYAVLARYEAAYRFETQFRITVKQNGRTVLDRLYGARANPKIWAFSQGVKPEVAWSWGAVENVVWEGHDALVSLQPGTATITLTAGDQPEPAARRNVDLVLLTSDLDELQLRLEKERYLPFDGLLTQAGDVFARLSVPADGSATTVTLPVSIEHSPYWVHQRTWKPKTLKTAAGTTTEWLEVGSLLDSLNDCQWTPSAKAEGNLHYVLEIGVPSTGGKMKVIARFESRQPKLQLACDAATRYTGRLRSQTEVLEDLVAEVARVSLPGQPAGRFRFFGYTFPEYPDDPAYTRARQQFLKLLPIIETNTAASLARPGTTGYADVRSLNGARLDAFLTDLEQRKVADRMAVISLGDEIGLPRPPAGKPDEFHRWLQSQQLKPADLVPGAGSDWSRVKLTTAAAAAQSSPRLYYWSQRYAHHFGIEQIRSKTERIRQSLPNAGIGANFSPHHGAKYLGETHMWVSLFRRGGMTMPWSEDYIWQIPVGTPQMNFLSLDMFRAGVAGKPDAKIHYYVMPHWPGNTPRMWRRQFYGDLAHGMQIANLFEFRPVQAAYTENHVSLPETFRQVRRAMHEVARLEEIVLDGRVRPGVAGLWFSETSDIWKDSVPPHAAGKRALYIALRHQQLPLDVVVEEDALAGKLNHLRVLYLTDPHVSRKAAEAIVRWVEQGGRLVLTATAGWYDEYNQPNPILTKLAGYRPGNVNAPADQAVWLIKQDLPFAAALDTVRLQQDDATRECEVISLKAGLKPTSADVLATFADGTPAVLKQSAGKGSVHTFAFLPGLSYFRPAIPRRPVDRGSTDDAMAHLIPTDFDPLARQLIGLTAEGIERPVECSEPLVASSVIESPHGLAVPLVNWSAGPVTGLKVVIRGPLPPGAAGNVQLASGGKVTAATVGKSLELTLDLDVADALILRRPGR